MMVGIAAGRLADRKRERATNTHEKARCTMNLTEKETKWLPWEADSL